MFSKKAEQKNIAPVAEASRGGKTLEGVVVSTKMKDTIVVLVERYIKNEKYQKFLRRSKRYKADDKGNTAKLGDKVTIIECAPVSKDKRHRLVK